MKTNKLIDEAVRRHTQEIAGIFDEAISEAKAFQVGQKDMVKEIIVLGNLLCKINGDVSWGKLKQKLEEMETQK